MKYDISEVEVNDIVTVNSNFGMGPVVVGIIDEVMQDIKHGIPGIIYHDSVTGAEGWAYIDQVIRIDHVPRHTVERN